MSNIRAGIFILTQNTIERKIYLKTSLYFLFRNFNKKYNYPVIILHDGDYDDKSQNEIISSIRKNHQHLIIFKQIDEDDFKIPEHIDIDKVNKIVELNVVPYWRNIKYRSMCYFWIKHFIKYTNGYDYVMRLDDDSIIEEEINYDLFEVMNEKKLIYASNIVHFDCGTCNHGMKEMFANMFPNSLDTLNKLFISSELKPNLQKIYNNFIKLHKILDKDIPKNGESIKIDMPIMYYNNFFITSTQFWKRDDVQNVIERIDKNGGIFYYRYGDAPLQTIIVNMFEPEKVYRMVFKYSKRLQREVFINENDDTFHSFFPKSYEHSTCIIQN